MILLAYIKEDVIESDAVEVDVIEVFEILDVALVAMEAAVSGFLISSLGLILLVNNMNNTTIPTQ